MSPRSSVRLAMLALEDRTTPTAIGSLDPTFDGDGLVFPVTGRGVNTLSDLAPTNDGGLVAVGFTDTSMVVVKLLNNGSLDPTFASGGFLTIPAPPGGSNAFATAVAVLADGTILVAGGASPDGVDPADFALVRVSAAGVASPMQLIDTSGVGLSDFARDIVVNPADGTVYLAGFATIGATTDFAVVRFNSGLVQQGPAVLTDLSGGNDQGVGIALDSTGRVFVSGTADLMGTNTDYAVVRYNADLTSPTSKRYDLTNAAVGAFDIGGQIAINSQDQIFVNGTIFTGATGVVDVSVIRIDGNLNLQDSAKIDFNGNLDLGNRIAIDAFDRVVVSAVITDQVVTVDNIGVARLLPDTLNLDPSFDGDGKQIVTVNVATANGQFPEGLTIDNQQRIVVSVSGVTSNPVLARIEGTVGLPPFSLIGGPTDGTGQVLTVSAPFTAFDVPGTGVNLLPGFAGVVRTAVADVNGDGFADLIAGAGPGDQRVIVYSGADNSVLADFRPFEASFTLGVFVAAGDFDNDGKAEVVVTPDQGGGARVIVYDGKSLTGGNTNPSKMADFIGLADFSGVVDDGFRGGARAAVGDITGDGIPDLIVAAGFLGGPRVTVWSGTTIATAAGGAPTAVPIANFFAFEQTLRNGAFAAAGDVNGDGVDDLIFGGGPTGGPRVRVADGKGVFAVGGSFSLDDPGREALTIVNFFAGDPESRGGIRVSARDIDGDQFADLVTGSGDGLVSNVRLYRGVSIQIDPTNPAVDQSLDPFAAMLPNGVFVG